jgi:putative SOS response-associated peptidase YedK
VCGRFTLTINDRATLGARFGVGEQGLLTETLGRANVCPTETVAAVVADAEGRRRAEGLRWGLQASWTQKNEARPARPLINARDDKLRSNGMWRTLASSSEGRCLVLADGWIEWQKAEDPKQPRQPFLHRRLGAEPFAFAALRAGETCAVVTTSPSREAAVLHDRMPAVLDGEEAEALWLDAGVDLDGALEVLRPLRDGCLEITPVSKRLNRAGTEGMDLLEPDPEEEPAQSSLF